MEMWTLMVFTISPLILGVDSTVICDDLDSNILATVDRELSVGGSRPVDVALIVDRSESVTDSAQTVLTIITSLLRYTIVDCKVNFHIDKDRLAVFPFGLTQGMAYDGVSDPSRSADMCAVLQYLEDLPVAGFSNAVNTTSLISALQEANDSFRASAIEGGSPPRHQLLFVFYDGEVHSRYDSNIPGSLTPEDYDRELSDAVSNLATSGVVIVTVAVGQWLDDDVELARIRDMATSINHTVCADTFLNSLELATNGFRNRSIYTDASAGDREEDVCGEGAVHACDVTTGTVTCQEAGVLACSVGEEEETTEGPTDAPTDAPTNAPTDALTDAPTNTPAEPSSNKSEKEKAFYEEMWFYIAVGAVAGVLIIGLVICACLCCRRDKRNKEEVEFGNIGLEKNMAGWGAHLAGEAESTSLLHLGVFAFTGEYWARTSGLRVREHELRAIQQLHANRHSTPPAQKPVVTVSDQHYSLVKTPHYGNSVWFGNCSNNGTENGHLSHGQPFLVLWINIVDIYAIVGVSHEDKSDICRKTVCGLGEFFKKKSRESLRRETTMFAHFETDIEKETVDTEDIDFSINGGIFSQLPDREYFSYLDLEKENRM